MTDPNDFLDPEPEPEPEIAPVREPFLSMATLLHNLPYIVALALSIFGVAYSNFSGHRHGICLRRQWMAERA
jgi:hypothetical protein